MSLKGLSKASLRFILFGGKGGVGKTTMTVASAIELARLRKVLIFTTDPAPSLADSFGQPIGNEPTAVAGVANLFAMEVNAKKVLQEFQEQHNSQMMDILQQGTYLADEEVEELLQLGLPGLDDVMGFKKIMDFMETSDYDLYLVDTAPTGHTLELLMLPELIDNWIKFLASLRWKYHTMVRHFAREERVEDADRFLLEMKRTVKRVKALLQSAEKTEFVVVTIAEKMAVSETEDLIKSLTHMHIPSHHIIVNNIFPPEEYHFARQRRLSQEKYIQEMKEKFRERNITEVTLQATEIQGITNLQLVGKQLFSESGGKEG
ncbi:MAG TPA: ArsA family ATPase [Ktedonobacteraceae bacterium]